MSESLSWLVTVSARIDVDGDVSTLQDRFLALLQDDDTVTLVRAAHPPLANEVAAVIRVIATDGHEMKVIAHDAIKRARMTAGSEILGAPSFGWTSISNYEIEGSSD
jgi:hypothetical protein